MPISAHYKKGFIKRKGGGYHKPDKPKKGEKPNPFRALREK